MGVGGEQVEDVDGATGRQRGPWHSVYQITKGLSLL